MYSTRRSKIKKAKKNKKILREERQLYCACITVAYAKIKKSEKEEEIFFPSRRQMIVHTAAALCRALPSTLVLMHRSAAKNQEAG